jgi:hypothetical protein
MQDKFTRYLQLSNRLVISFVAFIVSLSLLLLLLRVLFGLLDSLSWFVYLFTIFIVIVPAAVFLTVFGVGFSRIKYHPSIVVKVISYIFSVAAIGLWLWLLGVDIYRFFKTASLDIAKYQSYSMLYLAGSVALIFLLAILQALTTSKEKDWMEKRKERLGE